MKLYRVKGHMKTHGSANLCPRGRYQDEPYDTPERPRTLCGLPKVSTRDPNLIILEGERPTCGRCLRWMTHWAKVGIPIEPIAVR